MSDQTSIDKLIEQSSLGTKGAQEMRHRVSAEKGRAMVRAAAARTTVARAQKKDPK